MRRPLFVVCCTVAGLLNAAPMAAAEAPRPVTYRPPVSAPVVDPFRPPTTPYGPGNRGLEYATAPATPVRAAAGGIVTFAGQVGGTLHVTVQHADGLRTTYAFLARVAVAAGRRVVAGGVVGESGPRLLFTARLGDVYLDPAVLLAASGANAVRLVPNRPDPARGQGAGLRPVAPAAAEWALGPER